MSILKDSLQSAIGSAEVALSIAQGKDKTHENDEICKELAQAIDSLHHIDDKVI